MSSSARRFEEAEHFRHDRHSVRASLITAQVKWCRRISSGRTTLKRRKKRASRSESLRPMQMQSCGSPKALLYPALSHDMARPAHDHRGSCRRWKPRLDTLARTQRTGSGLGRRSGNGASKSFGASADCYRVQLLHGSYHPREKSGTIRSFSRRLCLARPLTLKRCWSP